MSLGLVQDTLSAIFELLPSVKTKLSMLRHHPPPHHRALSSSSNNNNTTKEQQQTTTTMLKVTNLPVEVIAKIFTFLSAEDHVSVSQVCKIFYDASQIEYIWMHRCQQDYNVKVPIEELTCKEVYTKLLYKFGDLIGLWQPEIASYGGLVEVKFEDGKLIGSELSPTSSANIKLPLQRKKRFIVELNLEKQTKVSCVGSYQMLHNAEVSTFSKNKFALRCQDSKFHLDGGQGLVDYLEEEAIDSFNNAQSQELLLMKYLVLCNYNYSYKYNRVFLPRKCDNVPIQPGVFKGTYGAHGLELIMLDYEENGTMAKAVKISGDPNVPAGKVTFMAELNYNMVLSVDEQRSMSRLENLVPVMQKYDSTKTQVQPFRVPPDCLERFKDVPKTCLARFCGSGQIAGHGFTNPSFTSGHWIIFDEDLFGFMWLDLLSLSMYHRVKEIEQ